MPLLSKIKSLEVPLWHIQKQHNMCTHQELSRIGSTSLPDEDPSSSLQLHVIRGPLDARHLRARFTVEVEHYFVVPHGNGKASPGIHRGRHGEPGRLVRLLRVWFRVKQDDVLLAALHIWEFDTNVHDPLWGVCDGEDNSTLIRAGLQVEDEGKVPVERAREVRTGQLSRVGVSTKDICGAVVGPIDLGYLRRWRIPDQLQQGDAAVLWMGRENTS